MSYLVRVFFVLLLTSANAQSITVKEEYIKDQFKNLMVLQTLISENRNSELKEFIDSNYKVFEDGRFITKINLKSPYRFLVQIENGEENGRYIIISVMKDTDEMKLSIEDKEVIYRGITDLFHEPGLPKDVYDRVLKDIQELADKEVEVFVKKINDYSFMYRTPREEKEIRLSNYTFEMGEKGISVYFFGPGRGDLQVILPITDEVLYQSGFYTFWIKTLDLSDNRKPLNKEFFLNLNDFNDRIWSDN